MNLETLFKYDVNLKTLDSRVSVNQSAYTRMSEKIRLLTQSISQHTSQSSVIRDSVIESSIVSVIESAIVSNN